jgi:hypothetical protein
MGNTILSPWSQGLVSCSRLLSSLTKRYFWKLGIKIRDPPMARCDRSCSIQPWHYRFWSHYFVEVRWYKRYLNSGCNDLDRKTLSEVSHKNERSICYIFGETLHSTRHSKEKSPSIIHIICDKDFSNSKGKSNEYIFYLWSVLVAVSHLQESAKKLIACIDYSCAITIKTVTK